MPAVGDVLKYTGTGAPAYQAGSVAGTFQGRIAYTNSTTLTLTRYNGDVVEVNGENVSLGAGGLAVTTLDNLITAAGADSGAAPGVPIVGTPVLYYAYVSNSLATFAALDLRLSAMAPTLVNGVYYLGAAGNALQWRFCGWVGLWNDGGGGGGLARFYDQGVASRAIGGFANYYNRQRYGLFVCPNYVNDGASTGYNFPGGNWKELAVGLGTLTWINTGLDASLAFTTVNATVVQRFQHGMGLDSIVTPNLASAYTLTASNLTQSTHGVVPRETAAGIRRVHFLAESVIATALNADIAPLGAAADTPATYMSLEVIG